ncbi:MAG: 30S ribosomal protein S13 [Euryarchaeota archaeon]|nr:30S ribosomal protein S13 [Euryarchaeota archaeon]
MAENEKSPEEKKQQPTKESAEIKPSEGKETPERKDAEAPQQQAAKPDQQKKKEKKGKQAAKEDEPSKKKEHDENFNYIIRIVNTDINGESNIVQGLTQIKGVGRHMATFIADTAGVDRKIKFGNLPESEIEKLKEVLENIDEYAPPWMSNGRKGLALGVSKRREAPAATGKKEETKEK